MSTRICPKCGFATMRPGPSAWECGRIIDCGYKDGDKLADADAEMREDIVDAILDLDDFDLYDYQAGKMADAVLALLRRCGAWLPGDPVTDAMVSAGTSAYDAGLDVDDWCDPNRLVLAITAALAARTP